MAWTVEDLILSRSNLEVLEIRSCSELDDRWKICSKSIKHISIEPEGYDYDHGINRTVLVDSPNVSSFSFNARSFDKFAVKNGYSPYELRKLWFKPSASFCKQASTNEQNSGENLCFEGVGDGSSKMCHRPQNFSCKTTADVGNGKVMNAATGPSLAVYGNSPVPHSKRARQGSKYQLDRNNSHFEFAQAIY